MRYCHGCGMRACLCRMMSIGDYEGQKDDKRIYPSVKIYIIQYYEQKKYGWHMLRWIKLQIFQSRHFLIKKKIMKDISKYKHLGINLSECFGKSPRY